MDSQNLKDALREVARAVRTAPERQKEAAVFAAFDDAGGVKPEALQRSLPPLMLTWWIPGLVVAGSNVGMEVTLSGAIRLRDVSVRAKTAPVTSECKVRLTANGMEIDSVAIQPGQTSGRSTIIGPNAERAAGETLRVDVVTASGAANVTVTVRYSLSGTAASSSASSGGTGPASGVTMVNGKSGIVILDADDIPDSLSTHKFVTAADLTTLASALQPGDVQVADIDATGTPSGTTYLRGDGTWSTPSGGGGSVAWGGITGTLSSQTDLQTALDAKANTSSLAGVALSGAYADLTGKPTIPTALTQLDTTVTGAQLNALKTKVDGIATGATANATDAQLRDRATHTGAQAISTVTGLQTALDAKADDTDLASYLTTASAPELIRDTMGSALVAGTNVTITPNDVGDTITIAAAGGGGATNLTATLAPTQITVNSDTGTDAVLPAADGTNAGLMLPAEKAKLTGIAAGAEVNVNADWNAASGDAQILNKPTLGTAAAKNNYVARQASAQTTTVITAANVTDMKFPVAANTNWVAEFMLYTGCSGTGGIKFAVVIPSGGMRGMITGTGTSTVTIASSALGTSGALSSAFNAVATTGGWVKINITCLIAATGGDVQIQFASGVAAQTSTIHDRSSVIAHQVT